eukprot:Sspe_Gene.57021::Locus_31316_Transcript_1_1_Confidence_1.000_Length_1463::g.57021::m.57021
MVLATSCSLTFSTERRRQMKARAERLYDEKFSARWCSDPSAKATRNKYRQLLADTPNPVSSENEPFMNTLIRGDYYRCEENSRRKKKPKPMGIVAKNKLLQGQPRLTAKQRRLLSRAIGKTRSAPSSVAPETQLTEEVQRYAAYKMDRLTRDHEYWDTLDMLNRRRRIGGRPASDPAKHVSEVALALTDASYLSNLDAGSKGKSRIELLKARRGIDPRSDVPERRAERPAGAEAASDVGGAASRVTADRVDLLREADEGTPPGTPPHHPLRQGGGRVGRNLTSAKEAAQAYEHRVRPLTAHHIPPEEVRGATSDVGAASARGPGREAAEVVPRRAVTPRGKAVHRWYPQYAAEERRQHNLSNSHFHSPSIAPRVVPAFNTRRSAWEGHMATAQHHHVGVADHSERRCGLKNTSHFIDQRVPVIPYEVATGI